MIAFSGVRSSWLTAARKRLLAISIAAAWSAASSSAARRSRDLRRVAQDRRPSAVAAQEFEADIEMRDVAGQFAGHAHSQMKMLRLGRVRRQARTGASPGRSRARARRSPPRSKGPARAAGCAAPGRSPNHLALRASGSGALRPCASSSSVRLARLSAAPQQRDQPRQGHDQVAERGGRRRDGRRRAQPQRPRRKRPGRANADASPPSPPKTRAPETQPASPIMASARRRTPAHGAPVHRPSAPTTSADPRPTAGDEPEMPARRGGHHLHPRKSENRGRDAQCGIGAPGAERQRRGDRGQEEGCAELQRDQPCLALRAARHQSGAHEPAARRSQGPGPSSRRIGFG